MIIDQLDKKVRTRAKDISAWLAAHSKRVLIPLYTSVDLRFSEYKIAPVDTNVFPSGFNNLTEEFQFNSGRLFKDSIKSNYPNAKRILIVPELSTRNP
ncbi:MAG: glutamate--cysteine ligase, partial [Thermodesulfobacteriota bacterium]